MKKICHDIWISRAFVSSPSKVVLCLIWRTVDRRILEYFLGYFVKGNVLPIHTRPCLPCCEDICFPGCASPHRSTTNQFVACSVSERAQVFQYWNWDQTPILGKNANGRERERAHPPYMHIQGGFCDDVTSSWPRFFLARG